MNLDKDQGNGRLASAASPRVVNFRLKGDEHLARVDGINSPTWGFIGPARFHGRHGKAIVGGT
jgi:hypothetical protein